MKLKSFIFLVILMTLWSCSSSKRIIELQNQVQNLEKLLSKQKNENVELSSFMTSLREQAIKPHQSYIKICQTKDTATAEILVSKYNELLQNYNRLEFYYNSLREKSEINKINLENNLLQLKDKNLSPQKQKNPQSELRIFVF